MALTPGYDYDIFISYAHDNNIALPDQNEGWIETFYKYLEVILKQSPLKGSVKIWWDDKRLDGSVVFDQSIEDGIKKSAIMICLNSNRYLISDYCKKELDLFYKKAQAEPVGLKVGERSRIINVLLNNIPFRDWPKELSGITGFPFHDAKEADDNGDPLELGSEDFRKQIRELRDSIVRIFTDFPKPKPEVDEPKPTTHEQNENAFTIFMGEVADTQRPARKRIITDLVKEGYNVVTGIPPPDEAIAHEQATNKALKNADLAVHILDEFSGREITGDAETCYPQKQAQLATASGKPQMIWVPAETDFAKVEDEKYKKFLEELETGKSTSKGFEFVRGSRSALAKNIIDYAEQMKAEQLSLTADKRNLSVLLDTHFNDQLYAFDLSKSLLENQIQPFINPQEDDPRKNIDLMGKRISQVKKLIFIYGSVSKGWVLERMSAALQLIITNNYPIDDFFVYMAPPDKEANEITLNQRFLKINVINNGKKPSMNQEEFGRFLNALKTGAA